MALPNTTNEVTVRRLSACISGLWNKIKAVFNNHVNDTSNPHGVTAAQIGLGNVTNDAQVKRTEMGSANGVATLDANGKIPSSQIPGSYDDVKEGYLYNGKFYYDAEHTQEITAAADMVYVDKSTNKTYRWSGTQYVVIGSDLALGETSSTAYRGDRGKAAYDFSQDPYTSNPAMDGSASAGSSTKWAKGDHVHPSDTSREAVANKTTSWSSTPSDTNYPSEKLVKDSLDNKVDKVNGKGLSTNDFTDTLKTKLDGISTGANKVQSSSTNGNIKIDGTETTVYTHPTTTAVAASAKKVGNDANGHVVLGDALAKGDVGLGNVDNTSDATKKTNFTGAVASGNTGFPTGGAVYDAIAANGKGVAFFTVNTSAPSGNPTYNDIVAAHNAGKLVVVNDNAILVQVTESICAFSGARSRIAANGIEYVPCTYVYTVTSENEWDFNAYSSASVGHTHEFFDAFCYCGFTENSGAAFNAYSTNIYELVRNGIVSVKFSAAVPASATLNINSNGAKSIYYNGSAIGADVIQQNDVATLMYDGVHYQLLAVDRSIKEMTDTEVTDLVNALT